MIFSIIFVFGAVLLASVWLWFVKPTRPALRVLMYHKLHPTRQDALTVTPAQLENHLIWLQQTGHRFVRLSHVLAAVNEQKNIFLGNQKTILLTFDDGFVSNLTWAYPLLEKYQIPAAVFLPTAFLGKTSAWEQQKAEAILSVDALKTLRPLVEYGLHAHTHQNYAQLTTADIKTDLEACLQTLQNAQLPFVAAFAYPFGGRPKTSDKTNELYQIFDQLGIKIAFRIGNRVNYWPFKDRFQIQRLDIRGTDSMEVFKQKVRLGKLL